MEREGWEWKGKGARGSLAKEGRLYLDICTGVSKFLVTPLLIGPVFYLAIGPV